MIIIYQIPIIAIFAFLGLWEKELIKRGESKHWPKLTWLSVLALSFVLINEPEIVKRLLIIASAACLYFATYDYYLNFIMKVDNPLNYKLTGKPWMKFAALMDWIGCIILYLTI
jgi:hypothetical protein